MTDLARLLVIGADSAIAKELPFGIKLGHNEIDVTNTEAIRAVLSHYNPSAVLCLASVDLYNSEKNPLLAYEVNLMGVYNVAIECAKRGIPIILISTGAVFSGRFGDTFSESSIPNPLNVYGSTKYLAEMLLQKITENHLIVRTGWLFGFSHKKSGFSKFVDKAIMSEDLSSLIATDDSRGSPTYIVDFVSALRDLIISGARGIVHVVNSGSASAYDVVELIASMANKENRVQRAKTNFNNSLGTPLRSQSECLLADKVILRLWEDALKDYWAKLRS